MESQLIIIGTIIVEHEGTDDSYEDAKDVALEKLAKAGFELGDVEHEDFGETYEDEFE